MLLTDDILHLTVGYEAAKRHIGQIFACVGLGNELQEQPYWVTTIDQFGSLLFHCAPVLLLNAQPNLIRYHQDNPDLGQVDIDNTLKAMILDHYIGQGYYKLEHLSRLARSQHLMEENWPHLMERMVTVLNR